MITEAEYRQHIQNLFEKVQEALDEVDPDVLESEQSQGSLVITIASQSRCILSAQPSVRQLWLAVASRGVAYHFNYEASSGQWLDDKGKGIELISFLESFLKDASKQEIRIK